MDLDDVLIQLKKDGDFEAGTGVPEERIKEAEISLATTFPEGYREFLIKYGFIEWSEAEIFGISENEY
ncbi:MAG: SMI1/KNR4 family protein, partial [Leptospiraceae bacterium]|nr:SMI1/KNR4 family protein [Leptospiraceae bacterium]